LGQCDNYMNYITEKSEQVHEWLSNRHVNKNIFTMSVCVSLIISLSASCDSCLNYTAALIVTVYEYVR